MKVVHKKNNYILELSKEEPIKGLRPAVDILMESVAKLEGLKKIGIVMTGMGSDGSKGIVQRNYFIDMISINCRLRHTKNYGRVFVLSYGIAL